MINLVVMCFEGFWHCERCERVVDLPEDLESPARCPHCKHATAAWHPPVFTHEKTPPASQPAGLAGIG